MNKALAEVQGRIRKDWNAMGKVVQRYLPYKNKRTIVQEKENAHELLLRKTGRKG